ncbi:MAG: hypothetical protein V3W34_12360 [Phycisphaerae bacterium]
MKVCNAIVVTFAVLEYLLSSSVALAEPVGTAFTYQGELTLIDKPVDGDCDFEFTLFDDPILGDQVGQALTPTVGIVDGRFTVPLDFGDVFDGQARWLNIRVCCPSACAPGYTLLDPRQELTPAPHAIRATEGVGGENVLTVSDTSVGIGTSQPNPGDALTVVGKVSISNGNLAINSGDLAVGGTNALNVDPTTSAVGVGTATQQVPALEVDGDVAINNGLLQIDGFLFTQESFSGRADDLAPTPGSREG